MTEIRIMIDGSRYWDWCCSHFITGTWKMKVGFMGTSATYVFDNPEDATFFKLTFGIK